MPAIGTTLTEFNAYCWFAALFEGFSSSNTKVQIIFATDPNFIKFTLWKKLLVSVRNITINETLFYEVTKVIVKFQLPVFIML